MYCVMLQKIVLFRSFIHSTSKLEKFFFLLGKNMNISLQSK